mgnify:CR=1 FL=1
MVEPLEQFPFTSGLGSAGGAPLFPQESYNRVSSRFTLDQPHVDLHGRYGKATLAALSIRVRPLLGRSTRQMTTPLNIRRLPRPIVSVVLPVYNESDVLRQLYESVSLALDEALCDGEIVWPPRGDRGFGYDPIFQREGDDITFGEMDPDRKHELSHRAAAFGQLVRACLDR